MGKWGQKSKWAKLFFSPLSSTEQSHIPTSSSSSSTTISKTDEAEEERKEKTLLQEQQKQQQEDQPQGPSLWKCSRCETIVTVPIDVTTKRPSYVVLAQHLEGNNKNVPVCAAGAVKYDESANTASVQESTSSIQEQEKQDKNHHQETITLLEKTLLGTTTCGGARVIIAVDDPKTPANMGSILRAMHCYGASGVIYSGERLNEALRHTPTDTRQSWRHIPIVHTPQLSSLITAVKNIRDASSSTSRVVEKNGECAHRIAMIAVDLIDAAQSLPLYTHPDQEKHTEGNDGASNTVVYVFGPEDGTLSQDTIDSCDAAVYMPTVGSMNLAASVNVLLYDRCAKHVRGASEDVAHMRKRVRDGESATQHTSESNGTEAEDAKNNLHDGDDNGEMRQLEADVMRNRNPNNRTKWQKKS